MIIYLILTSHLRFLSLTAPSTMAIITTTTITPVISRNIDLMFMIDSSYLLGNTNYWRQVINFMVNIINSLSIGPSDTQVGIVVIGWPATSVIYLNTYSDKTSLISAIQALKYSPQWTNLAYGLHEMTTSQFTGSHGDRSNYPNVAVVILATAADQGLNDILSEAETAWKADITIYGVGIKPLVNRMEIQNISSSPHELNKNYFILSDSSQLSSLVTSLVTRIFSSGTCQTFY